MLNTKQPRFGSLAWRKEWEAGAPEREALIAAERAADEAARPEREARELAARTARQEQEFARIVGAKYAGCRLSTFEERPGSKPITDRLLEIAGAELTKLPSIIWTGGVGAGKDHLLSAMLRAEFHKCRTVRLDHGSDFAGLCRDQISSQESEAAFARKFTGPDIWAISDPDGQRATMTDFVSDWMLRILDARVRLGKPTWATINAATSGEIYERLGSRIADRLLDGAVVLVCNWPSFRKPSEVIGSPK